MGLWGAAQACCLRPRRVSSEQPPATWRAMCSARRRLPMAVSLRSRPPCSWSPRCWRCGSIAGRAAQHSDHRQFRGEMPMQSHDTCRRRHRRRWSLRCDRGRACSPAQGRSVLLLDRAGRIKPCGGAIPPRLIRDFDIPDELLVARVTSARIVSPKDRHVDMPIDGGFVGMVDRDVFDEWLRERAATPGASASHRHLRGIRARRRRRGGSALSRARAQDLTRCARAP